jgi:class 3 adenylate cyclase/tetratricopeptide (TPR) repeat protein
MPFPPLDRHYERLLTNARDAKFCSQCAASLEPTPERHTESQPREHGLTGERRHLTVLFCDLVGSTEIAARLDPEEWRDMVAIYHRAAAEAITHYGGHVAKFLGDGVMAFFGYPEAHDNDAERAARAGLAMLDVISKLGEEAGRPKLAARVGIDSGAVVVGAGAGKEADVFGEAPNIAARVQAAAEPGTVLITDAVHQLVSGLFVFESRGAPALKGIQRPLQLYQVVQPSGVRGRLEAAAAVRGLTPFVGREDELRLLQNRWERALEGEGQVVLVSGEAGIGKSRLLQRFHVQVLTPYKWLEAAAAPFFQNTPFHAIAELLHQLVGQASLPAIDVGQPFQAVSLTGWKAGPTTAPATAGDGEAHLETNERLAQLESALLMVGLKPTEAIPLIAPLLNLPASTKYPPPPIPPDQQRRRLLAMLVEWVLGAARAQPLVIALEDLHWADASTLEVVQLLVEQGPMAHLLLLCTARPEFHPQWPLRAHHMQITLNRLSARNVREMIVQVAARHALAGETVDTVIERTGGVPLFVEELTRAVLESGSAKLAGREIPVTLHDSLMARLDRLGSAKEVIQIGAVIGGEFSYDLLHAVHPVGAEELESALRSATDAELVYVRGIAPEATYQFKHALIRDAAYEALLKSRRKELHRQVARTISEKFLALREAHPEVLARHWTEAGEAESAVVEWERAGKAAETRNAFLEAEQSYQQAVAQLNLLPESLERDMRELKLRQSVLAMLQMTRGYAHVETIEAFERTAVLAEKSGSLTQLVSLMISKANIAVDSGDFDAAVALGNQALELSVRDGNPTNLGVAYALQIIAHNFVGDLAGSEQHFTAGLKFFDDAGFRQIPAIGPLARGAASQTAWHLGRAELARQRIIQMMAAANRSNPFELAFAEDLAAVFDIFMGEYSEAEAAAARALELSENNHLPQTIAFSLLFLGQARAHLGRAPEGIALIRQAIAGLAEIGTRSEGTSQITILAEAQALAGAWADALETIERVLKPNDPGIAIMRPEALRLRGEIRLKLGHPDMAEADSREAIALAKGMGAKAFELRSTLSLARLLRDTGRRDEAQSMLAEIYNWFTEGFDTADLKEAKALLDELNR